MHKLRCVLHGTCLLILWSNLLRTIRQIRSLLLLYVVIGIATRFTYGLVRQVPAEYETIQAALDSAEDIDTVRVAPGVYHEFLSCQTNVLTLTGWHSGDTLPEYRSVIDPITCRVHTPSTF